MGPTLSSLQDDGTEKEQLQLYVMMKHLQNKLNDFEKERDDNVKARPEIGGDRTVQRYTTMRIVHKNGTSEGIKSAVGDFFNAAQGGEQVKACALEGAQKQIKSAIDGVLGARSGTSNECSEYAIVFMNHSFVRVDYMAYYFNVEGRGILKSGQQGGFCSIMDVSIIPHKHIRNEKIEYLLSQVLHMDERNSNFQDDLDVLMKLERLLAEERLVTRRVNVYDASSEDLRRMKEAMNDNKKGKIEAMASLRDADYQTSEDLVRRIRAYDEAAASDRFKKIESSSIFHEACEDYADQMVAYYKNGEDHNSSTLKDAKKKALENTIKKLPAETARFIESSGRMPFFRNRKRAQ